MQAGYNHLYISYMLPEGAVVAAGPVAAKMISLLYHDVVLGSAFSSSGFGGDSASRYKLDREAFEQHLAAISGVVNGNAPGALDAAHLPGTGIAVALTFDDGGASAHQLIADLLEKRGWRGSFFITTDFIGKPGFLTAREVEDLSKRGHSIGSHSCSHPPLFARQSHEDLVREWRDSTGLLSSIVGAPVRLASVPGGFYARNVADAASECGISALFTSEAVASHWKVGNCTVFGRFTIQRGVSPRTIARLVAGDPIPRVVQYCEWAGRKMFQRVGGLYYHKLRRLLLNGSPHPNDHL
jgi:peptidoglycan/xylan/chitin deacetylase (PgdA/CDA1 family)